MKQKLTITVEATGNQDVADELSRRGVHVCNEVMLRDPGWAEYRIAGIGAVDGVKVLVKPSEPRDPPESRIMSIALFRPEGRCIAYLQPSYRTGTNLQLAKALTHRLCARALLDNMDMQKTLGYSFRGCIYVSNNGPETGWVALEAADWGDLRRGCELAEFVFKNLVFENLEGGW